MSSPLRLYKGTSLHQHDLLHSNFTQLIQSLHNHSESYVTVYSSPTNSVQFKFREFQKMVLGVANYLLDECALEIKKPVMVLFENSIEALIVYSALLYTKTVVVPVEPNEKIEYYNNIASDCGARMVIAQDNLSNTPQVSKLIHLNLDQIALLSSDKTPHIDASLETPAAIFYSSGTTGEPKGTCLNQGQILANAEGVRRIHKLVPASTHLSPLPLYHVNAFNFSFIANLYAGSTLILLKKFFQTSFWEIVEKHNVHIVSAVPTIIQLINQDPRSLYPNLDKLKYFVTAAAPLLPKDLDTFYQRYKIPIIQSYGLSEAVNFSLCVPPEFINSGKYSELMLNQDSLPVGSAFWGNEVELLDNNDNIIEVEKTIGEICLRGWNLMNGYLHKNKLTQDCFASNWLHTGDIGYFQEFESKKIFYITGRSKEVIKRFGESISLSEIDKRLSPFFDFDYCAVGFKNNHSGEDVGLFIVGKHVGPTDEEILKIANNVLPFSKAPKVIIRGKSLPKTSTGKIKRSQLSALFSLYSNHYFKSN